MSRDIKHIRWVYNQLDWWGQHNKDVDGMAKSFLHQCTETNSLTEELTPSQRFNSKTGHLQEMVQKLPASAEIHCTPIHLALAH